MSTYAHTLTAERRLELAAKWRVQGAEHAVLAYRARCAGDAEAAADHEACSSDYHDSAAWLELGGSV